MPTERKNTVAEEVAVAYSAQRNWDESAAFDDRLRKHGVDQWR